MNNLFLLYLFLTIIILFYELINKNKSALFYFSICILFPILGLLIYALSKINYSQTEIIIDTINFDSSSEQKIINLNKNIDFVPLNDALYYNSKEIKRNLVSYILKSSPENHLDVLLEALRNNDTETVHYAASTLSEFKGNLSSSISNLISKSNYKKENSQILYTLFDLLKLVLNSKVLDEFEYKKYQLIYSNILDNIIKSNTAQDIHFYEKINIDINLNNFSEIGKILNRYLIKFPTSENFLISRLKYNALIGNTEEFYSIIKNIKIENTLSDKTNSILSFWNNQLNYFNKEIII